MFIRFIEKSGSKKLHMLRKVKQIISFPIRTQAVVCLQILDSLNKAKAKVSAEK